MDRALLNKATRANDEATPGYLHKEIASMTYASATVGAELEDFLLKRLNRDDPYVKLKVLKIIKYVSENGNPEFRRALQRKTEAIKQCMSYHGPAHPVRGDAPSHDVRVEAETCLKVLFGPENYSGYGTSVKHSGRIEGFGNEATVDATSKMPNRYHYGGAVGYPDHSSGMSSFNGSGGGDVSGKMSGFGNPNFDHAFRPTKSETIIKNLGQAAVRVLPESVLKKLDDFGVPVTAAAATEMDMGPTWSTGYVPHGGRHYGADRPSSGFGSAGYRMGPSRFDAGASHMGGGSSYVAPTLEVGVVGVPPSMSDSVSRAQDRGVFERKLVDDICVPLGAKVCPAADALTRFCRQCGHLDLDIICDLLREKLQQRPSTWQQKLRILYIIEALCDTNMSSEAIHDGMLSYLTDSLADVLRAIATEVPQCHPKASKLLKMVGEEPPGDPPAKDSPSGTQKQQFTASTINLLDFDEPAPKPAPKPVSKVPHSELLVTDDVNDEPLISTGSDLLPAHSNREGRSTNTTTAESAAAEPLLIFEEPSSNFFSSSGASSNPLPTAQSPVPVSPPAAQSPSLQSPNKLGDWNSTPPNMTKPITGSTMPTGFPSMQPASHFGMVPGYHNTAPFGQPATVFGPTPSAFTFTNPAPAGPQAQAAFVSSGNSPMGGIGGAPFQSTSLHSMQQQSPGATKMSAFYGQAQNYQPSAFPFASANGNQYSTRNVISQTSVPVAPMLGAGSAFQTSASPSVLSTTVGHNLDVVSSGSQASPKRVSPLDADSNLAALFKSLPNSS
eukprot:Selendium_serpulae@DN6256_c0_g1_i10.p1